MKEIFRTYEDTEVSVLSTSIKCPYCGREWAEDDMSECGKTYELTCDNEYNDGCGMSFTMYFDAS